MKMSRITSESVDLGISKRRENIKRLYHKSPKLYRWRLFFGIVFILFCVILGGLLLKNYEKVMEVVSNSGPIGWIGFTVFLSIAVVLLLPTPVIKIFAGAIFPLPVAIIVNFFGTMIGGITAFIFGRWLFRDALTAMIENNSKMKRIEAAIGEESMRISILVRLSPIIPDEWLNYILSAGPVKLRAFVISSCASIVYCLIYSYYGWAFGQIALKEGGLKLLSNSSGGVALLVGGLVATIAATIIVTRVTMGALEEVIEEDVEVA